MAWSAKDLLDETKLEELEKSLAKFRGEKHAEKTVKILQKLDNQDNASRLNQMGQMGNKMLEWGVEPDEWDLI